MGKAPNGLGKFSGKVGGVVFAISNGEQIVRAYQPVVSNPKSTAQLLQRAKGNLVGQLSKVTPRQILLGLGSNARMRRAKFLRNSLRFASAEFSQSDSSVINAKLPNDKFIYAEGAKTQVTFVNTISVAARQVTLQLVRIPGVTDAEFAASGTLVVLVLQSSDEAKYENVLYRFVSAEDFGANTSIDLVFEHIGVGGYYADAYVAPFGTTDGSAMSVVAESMFGSANDFNANMVMNPNAMPLEWGNSVLSNQATFTPSAKSDESNPKSKK